MRLFFALWPPAAVRGQLAGAAAACRAQCGGRAVPAPNLHATLAFLGEVPPSRIDALIDLTTRLARPRFDLLLDHVGCFRRARIVYAGASAVAPELAGLAADLAAALADAGFPAERRPYVPHVTLLRDARGAPAAPGFVPVMWHVRHIVLAESVRGASGPVYRDVHRFMLDP